MVAAPLAASGDTGVTYKEVARSGATAPAGGAYINLDPPAMNESGNVAFLSWVGAGNRQGLYYAQPLGSGYQVFKAALSGGGLSSGDSFIPTPKAGSSITYCANQYWAGQVGGTGVGVLPDIETDESDALEVPIDLARNAIREIQQRAEEK